ncbi:maltose O-acetyltransferase [Saccharothrix tamanrassetensis]|uniref:Maltose O-acetyltransferase n=1 Tax=Saccharothrix tamanrassetensis TaxID=1051531 RepID=A0A841CCJ6_9PSEU|nr:sugar O-acetyltransferase [Saccharothrix tamanrassetensis]MBB5953898.1 maltose O-acetyltransferase [Saccharothrix tamanrassetensis]
MGEHKDRLLRGEWYLDEPDLVEERRHCARVLDDFNATGADDDAERHRLLSGLFGGFGPGARVLPRFQCSYGFLTTIGANSFVNTDAIFMDDAAITIGDDVRIGPRAQLLTALHPVEDHERRRAGWERAAPITIGDNAWLGGGVIVCPGVTIGRNTVIGAGSVVIRDLPDHVFAAGNPAKVIRRL